MPAPFFSIIVPIHNAEAYLRGCLHSLLGQSFDDYEVICFDDASTDRSMEVCTTITGDDERFTLITSGNNVGVSALRNRGIEVAKGEYVLFVDADDYLAPDTLLKVHETIVADRADIVVFGGKCFPGDRWPDQDLDTRRIIYTNDGIKALMEETGSRPFIWNKAYRRALLNEYGCELDEHLKIGEDQTFQFTVFPYANVISYIPDKLYHYRQDNPRSATAALSDTSVERVQAHIQLVGSAFSEWKRRGWLTDPHIQTILGNWIIGYLFNDITSHSGRRIQANAATIVSWLDDPVLKNCILSEHNELELRCLRSLATIDLDKPEISVIMPIYNVESYLDQALDSLRRQTMAHFEMIMVDDGSTDGTISIAERYCVMDPRFHLERQQHGFAGKARNKGMSKAKGEYLLFLDGDDYFDHNMLEIALRSAKKYNADICVFGARRYDHPTGTILEMPWSCDCSLVPRDETFSRATAPDNIFCFTTANPWSKLYRSAFVQKNHLEFQAIRSTNDVSFVLTSLAMAERIIALDETLLTYRINEGSSLQSTQDQDPFAFFASLLNTRNELVLRNAFEDTQRAYLNFALDCCLHALSTLTTQEGFQKLYSFLKQRAFAELGLLKTTRSDFYVHSDTNYERMRFIQHNPPRSYQIKYPSFTKAPLIPHDKRRAWVAKMVDPIRRRTPAALRKPIGQLFRRITNH